MASELTVRRESTGADSCTLVLQGALDLDTYETLEHQLAASVSDGKLHITLDLSGITFISSAGFGVFIEAAGTVQELGGWLKFINPSEKARDVFRLLGILLDSCDFD